MLPKPLIKIAEEVWEKEGFPGDHYLLEALHQHATPTLDWLARALSAADGPSAMLAYTKLEVLKFKCGIGHFRPKAQLYTVGLKAMYHQLALLRA